VKSKESEKLIWEPPEKVVDSKPTNEKMNVPQEAAPVPGCVMKEHPKYRLLLMVKDIPVAVFDKTKDAMAAVTRMSSKAEKDITIIPIAYFPKKKKEGVRKLKERLEELEREVGIPEPK
jgi:hypothetical protein